MKKFILILFFSLSITAAKAQTAMEVILMMYKDASTINGFIAEINKVERVNEEYIIQLSEVKLNRESYKVYIKQLSPKEGVEVLASKTAPTTKATINLNSFPWINLYLNPYGTLMRRNQHHLVYDSGFDLMIEILKHELSSELSKERIKRKQDVIWQGREMFHLELKNDDYRIEPYTVLANETIDNIANKLFINAYAVLQLNELGDYEDVEEGDIIKVPSHYAKSMTLYIDKETHLPLVIKVFDQAGLYEMYEYNSIIVNPVFAPNEFTEDFEHYNF